jgi:hypothetical protein
VSNEKPQKPVPPITDLLEQQDSKADKNVKGGGVPKLPDTGSMGGVPIPYPNTRTS